MHEIVFDIPTAVGCGSLDPLEPPPFMITATDTGYNIVGSETRTCGANKQLDQLMEFGVELHQL